VTNIKKDAEWGKGINPSLKRQVFFTPRSNIVEYHIAVFLPLFQLAKYAGGFG
jgi:hypothetical protein